MVRILMSCSLMLLLCACQDSKPVSNGALIEKYYANSQADMQKLTRLVIDSGELQQDLKIKLDTVAGNSLDVDDLLSKATVGNIPFTGKLTQSNFMYLYNTSTMLYMSKSYEGTGIDSVQNYRYNIFVADSAYDGGMPQRLQLWDYLQRGNKQQSNSQDAASLTRKLQKEANAFTNLKYIVAVNDYLLVKPKMSEGNTFETGVLVSGVKVFDAATGKKLAQMVLVVTNPESLNALGDGGTQMNEHFLLKSLVMEREIAAAKFIRLPVDYSVFNLK